MLFCSVLRAFFTFTGMSSSGRPVPPPRLSRSVPPFARRGLLLFALLCLSFATFLAGGAAAQEVMFSSGTYRANEGDALTPELVLSHARSEDVTVRVEALDLGEAKSGEDFEAEPWHVTIPAGRTRQTFSIATFADGRREHNEQFLLHIAPYGHSSGLRRSSDGNADAVAYITGHTGIWLSESRYTVWEGGTARIEFSIDNPKPAAFTLDYTLSGGTASGADVVGGFGTRSITVPANARRMKIPVGTVQDTIRDEATETFSVRLSTLEPHVVFGRGTADVWINDDDTTPTMTFASSSSSANEGVGTHDVTVKLWPAPAHKVTLKLEYARLHPRARWDPLYRNPLLYDGSTATPDSDYEISLSGSRRYQGRDQRVIYIPVPAGVTTVTVPVTVIDDHDPEDDETVVLQPYSFSWEADHRGNYLNRRVTPHRTHTLTIVDDDLSANPVVSFASEFQDVDEGPGTHNVTLYLSTRPPSPVTVGYTVGGTATAGSDFTALSGTVTVPAGERTATVPVTIPDDGVDDAGETMVLTLAEGEGYRVGSRNTHRLNIDVPPVVYFPSRFNRSAVRESAGTRNVTVNLSAASTSPVTVNYTVGGTATPGSDYAALSGTVTVPAGTIKASIPVRIIDDTHEDSRETIVLRLAGGTGYRVIDGGNFPRRSWGGPYSHHTLVIANHDPDDVEGQVQAQLDAAVAGGDSASANLWRRALAAIRGEAPPNGLAPLTAADAEALAAGHSGKGEVELASLWTEIAGVIGDGVTPLPPAEPAVTILAGASPVTEGGDAVFTVTADPAPAADLAVTVAVAAEGDYGIAAGEQTVTIPATGSAVLTLTTTGDDAAETDGSVTATVAAGEGYTVGDPASGTVAVQDDDEPPPAEPAVTISAGSSPVTEGGDAVFTVTANPAPAADLAVTVAVAVDGDYGIAAGEQTVTIPTTGSAVLTLTTTGDEADETDGSVTATVTDGDGYTVDDPASGTVAVQDDDEPPPAEPEVTISAGSSPVTEGGDAVFTVTTNPAPAADLAVTVTVAVEGDFGVTAGERTMTVPATGSATLTLATTGDEADETDGSVTATVKDGEGYTVGSSASGTVAIADDDPAALVATAVDPALVAQVRGYAAETYHGQEHVDRWKRVLAAFGDDNGYTAMTAAEAQTHADRGWQRWVPVVAALEALEAAPVTLPAVTVSAGADVTEGGNAAFTITASPAPAAELSVTVTVATAGEFGVTAGSRPVTIPVTGSAVLTLTTANDEVDEPDGSVSVTVAAGNGYTVGDPASGTVAVQDDDAPLPGITIAAGTSPVTEGGDAAFTVTANPAPAAELAVSVTVAAEGEFGVTAGKQTVTIPTTGSAVLTLATANDEVDEADGSVSVTVAAGEGYTVGDPASGTVAVQDDDLPPPVVTVTAKAGPVTEGGDAVFTVSASPAPASPLAVGVTVAAKGDYGIASGTQTVSIPATGSATLTLATSDDDADEPDGSVSVTVAAGDGYTVGDPASGSVSIADDDLPPPAVSIAATAASVTEGGAAAFTLTADRAPDADLTVTLSVAETGDGDHVAAADEGPATAVIAKGATEAFFSVATVDDDVDEPDGAVTVTLKDGGDYTVPSPPGNAAAVTVSDNDAAVGPVLSVDDETGKENGRLPAMPFTVRLSAPAQDAVRVYVSTRPSTPVSATPRVDYTPASYALLFRAGETEKQVWVMIHNDSHDEEPETFEVVLSKAQGAPVGDGVAVGTITNDDPLPGAWLARFGRAVAEQALDGIAARMTADRTPGLRGSIAGQALDFGGNAAGGPDLSQSPGSLFPGSRGAGPGLRAGGAGGAGPGLLFGSGVEAQSRGMTMQEVLRGSSFSLTGEADGSGGTLSFWGGSPGSGGLVSGSRFAGSDASVRLDGETGAALLGTDYARGRWLVGFALSQVRAEGGYASEGGSDCSGLPESVPASACAVAVQAGNGEVEAFLTATIPYVALAVSERLRLWGAAGQGAGDVTVKTGSGGSYRADTAWSMAAAGLRGDLLAPPAPGPGSGAGSGTGPALALTSDALWVRTSSEKTVDLAASESDVSRLRVGLEGSWGVALSGGGSVTPKLELGARHDGGDAETGFGVELGGGLAWRDPKLGLTLDLSGRTLVAHDDGGLEDRGVSARLSYDPEPSSGRGLSLSLGQDWGGRAQGGLDALFQPEPLEDRAGSGDGHEATSRWGMEAAWGLPAFGGRFTGSPYMGLGLATGARDYSLGWRLTPEAATAPGLSFGLRATRRESDTAPAEHTVGVELSASW